MTPLALAVLYLLHERPAHPYELHQTITDRGTDRFVKVRAGSLYHTVERLHRLGLIEPVQTGREGRRPERTVYGLTQDGSDQFRSELRAALRHPIHEYPLFGSAVEMLHALDPAEAADLLEYRVVAIESAIAGFDQAGAGLARRGHSRIDLIEIEYATAMLRAELGWVLTLIDEIRSGALRWRPRVASTAGGRPQATHETPGGSMTIHETPEGPTS